MPSFLIMPENLLMIPYGEKDVISWLLSWCENMWEFRNNVFGLLHFLECSLNLFVSFYVIFAALLFSYWMVPFV